MSDTSATPNRHLPEGSRVGHYKVGRKLGEGGMGMVYVATDTRLRRTVALKVLHGNVSEDSERRHRFLREGRLAAGLTHPCIATVYEVGDVDGRLYIAMELVEGRSVGALLEESPHRRLKLFTALRIVREVTRGLVKAHESGIVHRDLKPDNVMYGEDQVVKILDFGVAKRTDDGSAEVTAHATQHGSLVGTPAYMSPEQAAGRAVDARSDIFSLGVMLYHMLTGQRPFQGETWQEVIISVARDPLVPASKVLPELPPSVDALVARCLEKRPDDRYPSARALLDDLEKLLVGVANGESMTDVASALTLSHDRLSSMPSMGETTTGAVAADVGRSPTEGGASASSSKGTAKLVLLGLGSAAVAAAVAGFVMRVRPPTGGQAPTTVPSSSLASAPQGAIATGTPSVDLSVSAAPPATSAVPPATSAVPDAAESAEVASPGNAIPPRAPLMTPPLATQSRAGTATPPQASPPPKSKANPVLGF